MGCLQCLIGDAAAKGTPPASCERGYAPAMAGGQATEPLPCVVGLLVAYLHINPVDGGRRIVVGIVLTDHGLWTLWPFPPGFLRH